MTRYAVRTPVKHVRNWDIDDIYGERMLPALQVDEIVPRFTGLLDAQGNDIVSLPEPIGFTTKAD